VKAKVMMNASKIKKKAKSSVIFAILLTSALGIPWACAADNNVRYGSVLKFAAGITTAFMIHEGAHAAVAELTGTDMDWKWGNFNQPLEFTEHASSDDKGLAINLAGLLSQAIASEAILQKNSIDKNDAFVRGMMIWNILNPISYSLDYWFFHRTNKDKTNTYRGDIQGVEYYADDPTAHGFAATMTAIALFQGYRFLKSQSWAPEWLKAPYHNLDIQPLGSGGFSIIYQFRF
jgi:hypothetical protein